MAQKWRFCTVFSGAVPHLTGVLGAGDGAGAGGLGCAGFLPSHSPSNRESVEPASALASGLILLHTNTHSVRSRSGEEQPCIFLPHALQQDNTSEREGKLDEL